MKYIVTATLFSAMFGSAAYAESINVTIQNTTNFGTVRAAVFTNQAAFDGSQAVAKSMIKASDGHTVVTFKDLKPGRNGIAVFHDLNGNETLDRNLFGAPKEPFGFSNDPKIGFSAPRFDKFDFKFDGEPINIIINLNGA
ncbi:DUF2141 domain-containing protein (plasmid) [Aliisedimentitalea scapharcae]|uniref:DUF2141 domain-containing protein n=1 Tax=Aliisedimentitalea scapharcae TaxID=1524259 RepID=A0ABZ2Y321_9RHOB